MEEWTWRHGDIENGHGDMDMETWTWRHRHGNMDMVTWRHGHRDMDMETWTLRHGLGNKEMEILETKIKRKTKPRRFSLIRSPFAYCADRSLKFVFCPFVDKEINRSYPFANGLNGVNGLACCIYAYSLGRVCFDTSVL
jgi:hypothetical protein